ncbi:hypothetical protein [Bacillus gaemokensis]|uniref:hypothetical protein n=1 Tax=Bacillus gaemokensis TaxID=574375 RepID=UPI0005351F02|nr:hypothetical protein [Bacillus gaemokensis]KYG38767.1 hypothetical protein AZF08_01655 [Bacillus gaemokensis]
MSLILTFLIILTILLISTYIGFLLWKHIKIIKYIPALLGFIAVVFIVTLTKNTYGWEGLGFAAILETKSSMN